MAHKDVESSQQSNSDCAITAKAEKITSLINGGGNHLGSGDRGLDKSSVSASQDRGSEIKASKSKDASQMMGGGASQSVMSNEVGPNKPKNKDSCSVCRHGGNLICCDHCPRSFHARCLGINKKDLPEGDWYCQTC
jgi:hypothetical protein